jgi:hypothetical protein
MAEYTEEVRGVLSLPLYDAETCRALVEQVNAAGAWRRAEVSLLDEGGYRSVVMEERSASVFAPSAESEAARLFDAKMNGVVKPLVKRVWGVEMAAHSAMHLVRYLPGDYYHTHTDVTLEDPYRYFSVVCYLNNDFEGGHTAFPDLGHAVAPRCGKTVVFPSTYLHRAEPVTRGKKYVIVSWLTGRPPVRWI